MNTKAPNQILVFTIFLLLLTSVNVSAQSVDDAIHQDIQIKQREKQEKQNLERSRDLQEIDYARKKSMEVEANSNAKEFVDDGKCRKIDKFEVLGNKTLNLTKFILPNEGKCLTKTDLQNIKKAIENFYIAKGYILARVYFGLQNIIQGKIEIVIEEGKAGTLEVKDDSKINDKLSYRRSLQKFFAFGSYNEKVVNLRDIEQGLDQMNRLSSNNAKMDIVPSTKAGESGAVGGYSDVVINNQVKNISKPSVGINNSGNDNTGRIRETVSLDQDNLIGINDNIYLSHSKSDYRGIDKKYFNSNYAAISIPFTYYTFGGSYSDSNYLTTTRGGLSKVVSSGTSQSSSYYISRVLSRAKQYKISLKTALDNANNKNYTKGSFVDTNSRKSTVAKFSLDNVFYTKYGTIFLQPKYNKGTKLMDALKDKRDLNQDTQRAQFNSYGLYGSVSNNVSIPKTDINLTHNLTFDSQISEDRLFPSEQINIGGRYTVRGFEESSISGDNGYYIKNDLTVNAAQIMPKIIQESFIGSALQKINIGTFYDYGYVRNKIVSEESDKGYMSGTGAKLNYNGEYFKADLTYAQGLHSPQFLRNIYHTSKDNESVYLDIKFGLF